MLDLLTLIKNSNSFRQWWRCDNSLLKEKSMQPLPTKRKTGHALQRKSRLNTNPQSSEFYKTYNTSTPTKWQYRRIAIKHGLSLSHAKLICSLSGIGGATND